MDDQRFDHLARALGGAATRRSALAALAGLLAGGAALDAEAKEKRRRKKCNPACAAGQTCRQGTCTCDNGGAVCGANCCTGGQRCEDGQCAVEPAQCLAAGAACKGVGVPCCDGLTCASGQGGQTDIACRVPAGGACAATADCVFDSTCQGGVCVANPQPIPTPPAPTCSPTFPVTADAGANGLALQQAVKAAASGATIVLAPGDYQLVATLEVKGKALTIERCAADAVVNLVFPSGFTGTNGVFVDGTVTAAALTLRGLTVRVEGAPTLTNPVLANGSSVLTIEDVYIESTVTSGNGVFAGGSSPAPKVLIKKGVTVRYTGVTKNSGVALFQSTGETISCEAPPVLDGFGTRCNGYVDGNGCGCTDG